MDRRGLVAYCGLYCGLCAHARRIPNQAKALRDSMAREGYQHWGGEIPRFNEFWDFLGKLSQSSCLCREGGGYPACSVRECAQERNIDVCVNCGDYPCDRVLDIAKRYPTLIADGMRMKEIGIDAWVEEQEERAGTGFAYADIRCEVR